MYRKSNRKSFIFIAPKINLTIKSRKRNRNTQRLWISRGCREVLASRSHDILQSSQKKRVVIRQTWTRRLDDVTIHVGKPRDVWQLYIPDLNMNKYLVFTRPLTEKKCQSLSLMYSWFSYKNCPLFYRDIIGDKPVYCK